MSAYSIVTPADDYPVDLADAKDQLRVTSTDDDAHILALIGVATEYAESFTGRALMTRTVDWYFDGFPAWFELPVAPLQSVTSVKYQDDSDAQQTLAADRYVVDAVGTPPRIVPAYGTAWPSTYPTVNAVVLRLVMGYGDTPEAVPANIRHAIKATVTELYEKRGDSIVGASVAAVPNGVRALLLPFKLHGFA